MPILKNCCVFIDLKVGTMIIGVLTLITALINTLSWAIVCVMMTWLQAGTSLATSVAKAAPVDAYGSKDDDYTDSTEYKQANKDASVAVMEFVHMHVSLANGLCYFFLVLALVLVIVDSMLIHGVKNNRRGLLFPFIIAEAVKTVILLIVAITLLSLFSGVETIVYMAISLFVGVGVEIYFILVVVSQYQALGIIRMHDEHALDMK